MVLPAEVEDINPVQRDRRGAYKSRFKHRSVAAIVLTPQQANGIRNVSLREPRQRPHRPHHRESDFR
jgi:hypothetical protein